jgi:hypothetical protein
MRRVHVITLLLLPLAVQLPAQEPARPDPDHPVGENLQVPPDWHVRLDKPDAEVQITADSEADHSDIFFVSMTPGWHITTGPRSIFWHPGSTTSGDFRAAAEIHLFPPGERNEAYGIFFGGSGLDGDAPSYDYFLVRRSGEFLIKRRRGDATEVIHDWTPHEAIVAYTEEIEGTATNTLALVALGNRVTFEVNGTTVAELTRDNVATTGLLGLRVNHHLDLHVSSLVVESLSGR